MIQKSQSQSVAFITVYVIFMIFQQCFALQVAFSFLKFNFKVNNNEIS